MQLHRLVHIGKWTKFFAKLLLKSNNLRGSGSDRISALPLPLKKDRFHRFRFRFHSPAFNLQRNVLNISAISLIMLKQMFGQSKKTPGTAGEGDKILAFYVSTDDSRKLFMTADVLHLKF